MAAHPRRDRRPVFRYASDLSPDRALVTAILIFLALGGGGLMLVAAFVIGPVTISAPWIVLAVVMAGGTTVLSTRDMRQMTRSGGRLLAAPWRVTLELALWTLAIGAISHGLGADVAVMGAALLPVWMLWVIFGDVAMVATGFGLCVVSLAAQAIALPSASEPTLRVYLIVVVSLLTAGLMTKLVAAGSVRAVRDFSLLNDMGVIAAGAHSLESSLEELMPKAAGLVKADRIVACRVPVSETSPPLNGDRMAREFARWERHPLQANLDTRDEELHPTDAVWDSPAGAVAEAGRSWMWARAPDGSVIVLAIDGRRPRYETQMSWQYQFDRIVPELEALVTLTGFINQLSEMTRTDYLTGLSNRRAFIDRLEHEVAAAERHNDSLTVAMLDLDNFKAFNDEHGHLLGDQLLRGFASLLLARARTTDLASRYGGEEFCLILPHTETRGAVQLLADLHEAGRGLSDPMGVTFSAGLSTWRLGDDPESLLARADQGLYRAKAAGRDRTVIAESELEKDDVEPR